ncbi:ComEC/Rec2 family competence protein [Candidatus Saccharibacteria bacterium]|nr:ComEC/Rec2 family competence protein [Candidatus Saccharibacteria bacterium]
MQKITLFLKRRQHNSIFIVAISLGILLGVVLALLPSTHIFSGVSWSLLTTILLIICFWKRYTWLIFFAFICGALIGLTRSVPTQQQLSAYSVLAGKSVSIQGKIADDVSIGKHGEKQVKLTNIKINNKNIPGTIWLSTGSSMNLKRSFEMTATGKISKGFGSFSAAIYRANIVSVVDTHTDKAREVRDSFSENVRTIFVTGLSPSMTRAGLVSGLSLAAWYYGRSVHPLVLLPFVAAITVIINPSFMWGDLGWYLSFAAFAGVMILAPLLQNYLFGPKKPGALRQIIGETISAQLATMPIIAFSFGTMAVFALPANLLVLPFVPFAMALVFMTGLAATFLPAIAVLFGYPSQILLGYMTSVVQLFVNLPNASVEVSIGVIGLIISYAVLVGLAIFLQLKTKHDFRNDNLVE